MNTSVQNSIERRRFKRYEINLSALLAFEEPIALPSESLSSLQCTILDFCTHGLFLEIRQSVSDLSVLLHKHVKILFSITTGQGKQYVHVNAEVMRVCSNGVGVAFDTISETIFQALVKKASSKSEPSAQPVNNQLAAQREKLKKLLLDIIYRELPLLMAAFFERVHVDLEQAAKQAESFQDESHFLNTSNDLKLCQDALAKSMLEIMTGRFDFIRKEQADKLMEQSSTTGLSLIDKNDFEDWLNFTSFIRKVENRFADELVQLDIKLSLVTGLPPKNIDNPLKPGKWFDAFKESINEIEELEPTQQTLFKVFGANLLDQLGTVYQVMDEALMACGAPEHAVETLVRPAADTSPRPRNVISPSIADSMENVPDNSVSNVTACSSEQSIPIAPQPSTNARPRQRVAETATRLLDIIDEKNHIRQTVGNVDSVPVGSLPAYTANEILAAISQMQNNEVASSEMH